jgi:hypothetical protein
MRIPDQVVRNGWPTCVGMGGRLGPEYADLFDVVCGPFEKRERASQTSETLDTALLLEIMHDIAESPEMAVIVQEVSELSASQRRVVLETLRSLNEKRKPQRGKKSH